MAEPVIQVQNVSKRFGGVQALRDISFDIWSGKVQCLVGENGCGKSTLVKIVSGVERPDAGTIAVNGSSHRALTPREAIQAGIEVIYQDLSLLPNLTVAENIAVAPLLAARRHFYSHAEARRLAQNAAERLGVHFDLDAKVGELPVSARQLVAICRSLTENARVIFMDEPTTSLTWREVQALFEVINRLVQHQAAVVFVSHKFNEILEIAENITVMRNGRVVAAGPVDQFDRASLSRAMTGREVEAVLPAQASDTPKPTVLEVAGLSSPGAFDNVTFRLHKGEVVGLTGLLGSGHLELGEALFGLRPIGSGELRIDGVARRVRSVTDALRWGVGYVPGDRLSQGLFMTQSVATNLAAPNIDQIKRRRGLISHREFKTVAKDMVSRLAIKTPSEDTTVRDLSGGHQQRVLIGKWLLRDPHILVVNGPTVGVDVGSRRDILQILRTVADRGASVLMISDDIPEVVEVCDRVLVMRAGRLVTELGGPEVREETLIPEIMGS